MQIAFVLKIGLAACENIAISYEEGGMFHSDKEALYETADG